MKLALVRQTYTPFGGAERFVERAMAALAAQGIDVGIVARRWNGTGRPVQSCAPFYLGRTWRDAGFARCVQRVIASGAFDLVQSHERIPGCHIYRAGDGVHATWLELRNAARGPWAALGSRLSPWHRYTLDAEAQLYRHPNLRAVICNSAMVGNDIVGRFGVPADNVHVIYNGVDLGHFHPGLRDQHRARLRAERGIAETAPVILFVGSGFERKGVPALLRALAALPRRDARLWVIGRDRQQAAMRRLADDLGVATRVDFFGGQADVRPYYGAADVFCLPTLYDPMPNAALEALACGLPALVSTTCGAAEIVTSGVNGEVCAARDVAALAAALERLCAESGQYAAAARASVEALSLEAMAGRLIDLYGRLLGRTFPSAVRSAPRTPQELPP